MDTKPYKMAIGSGGHPYIDGPNYGTGVHFSYYGGTLSPESRFATEEDALRCSRLCNAAYMAGYSEAQKEIKKALGL